MDYSQLFFLILGIFSLVTILAIIFILVEFFRCIRNVRLVLDRFEMLTDVSGWLTMFKMIFRKKDKKDKRNR
ncbi:MAG: hypothetical protein WC860_02710 [Candidatus Margulisiibacteriota bacterium]|jgi:hypothetical protein